MPAPTPVLDPGERARASAPRRGPARAGGAPRSRALAAVLLLGSLLALPALGEVAERQVRFDRASSALLASTSFSDLFDGPARRRLDSGFWNQVVVRLAVHRVGQDQPVSLALRTCRVRYEVWDELYEVQVEDHVGRSTRQTEDRDEVVRLCTTLERFPVASLEAVRGGRSYLVVIAELNPVSEELLDSIRRWLRSPHGGHRRLDQGDSFFGSAVAIFVNHRIGRADRQIRYRSQTFGL